MIVLIVMVVCTVSCKRNLVQSPFFASNTDSIFLNEKFSKRNLKKRQTVHLVRICGSSSTRHKGLFKIIVVVQYPLILVLILMGVGSYLKLTTANHVYACSTVFRSIEILNTINCDGNLHDGSSMMWCVVIQHVTYQSRYLCKRTVASVDTKQYHTKTS